MMRRQPPWSAVIVDDEPAARDVIRTMLEDFTSVRVTGEAGNGVRAVEVISRLRPDLLFLDVQMPDLDGFGVIERLGDDVPRGLVFVTAHDAHALRAFDVHALDYILKPFGRPRFRTAVERAIHRLEAENAIILRRTLAAMLRSRKATLSAWMSEALGDGVKPSRLAVRHNGRTVMIVVEELDWIEADRDYARLHTGGRAYLVAERMNVLEARLDSSRFQRIHRSTIVNLGRVRELHRADDGGGEVVLDNGVRLRVARNRWSDLERSLGAPT